jgi:hypothetical protein
VRRLDTGTRGAAIAITALAALFLAALPGSAATAPRQLRKNLPSRVESLAMQGSRVAYDVAADYAAHRSCNKVYAWNVGTRATTRVSGSRTCDADSTSTGAGVRELAIAGKRVAWIVNQGGNSESDDYLYIARLPKPKEHRLASAIRIGEPGGVLAGPVIGGLVGGGGYFGVNRWTVNEAGTIYSPRLQTIGRGLRTIATGRKTMDAQATDGKRIAVLTRDGVVAIYSTAGRLLFTVTPPSPTEVGLRGDYLAVLTTADTLEVYSSHSGRHLHTWRVSHGARSLDVSSGLAAYAAERAGGGYARVIHLLRLSSGRDRVVVTTPPQIVGVQLEPAGLAYAVNWIGPRASAYLVFVPMSRLPH